MLKDKTFTYRGHTFQVRASLSEKGWAVQVYESERPISPTVPLDGVTPLKLSCELLRAMWKKNIFQR